MYHGLHFSPLQQPPVPTVGQPPYVGQFMADEVSMTPYGRGQFAPVYMVKKEKWHPTMVSGAPYHPVYVSGAPYRPYSVTSKPMSNYGIFGLFKKKDKKAEATSASPNRIVQGKGGYKYEQDSSGNIWIVKKPGKASVREAVRLNSSQWKAITAEIGEHPSWSMAKAKAAAASSPASSPAAATQKAVPAGGALTGKSNKEIAVGLLGEFVKGISPQIPAEEYEISPTVTVTEERAFPIGAAIIAGSVFVGLIGLIVVAAKNK
tara:strand:- start:294 stop:1079 length:786 start_codon:yes stop_codon:yes gene_type:complete